ncbi:2-dehydro-3-deoxygalactonokinase [Albimonas sp. CAU 1670]|uniref:2-dehydro-3-deoxygalactonokinase n=1 Tax=Albimonas sp. CAU 1670 TaxID=3032599 RepID=UPI0023DB5A52|nr:2-dehydro-3-deoxygalactonokinase [Albimonas sp. CAU 1670]MDF2233581.1 2-dehydro-3-deoxygalactonokinase [Albimonas sp. CAU 1670]
MPDAQAPATLIALDWGTSSLRACLLDAAGAVLDRRESAHGIRALPEGGFPAAFAEAIQTWPEALPVLMSGMVGARSGWREAPYAETGPQGVGLANLAAALTDVSDLTGRPAWIVPGVSTRGPSGPDVMRGEETQIVGAGAVEGTLALPGTHSKWVELRAGRIAGFRTSMTGELYAALSRHTILADTLAPPADAAEDAAGFAEGLAAARALETPGDLLGAFFSIRARALFSELPPGRTGPFLSGLLIGAEIAANAPRDASPEAPVGLIANEALAARYAAALTAFGLPSRILPPDIAAAGLHAVARAARLTGDA